MLKKSLIIALVVLIAGTASGQSAAEKYIQAYKDAAIRAMNEHGVPASIVLGVAIHESASGTSKISRYLNNHFGLKGKGGPKPIPSAYKGYENVDSCYKDFVGFLKRRFNGLFIKYPAGNYQKWALGIQRGGYAASKTWASQVMGIIKKYRLYEYDNGIPESLKPLPSVGKSSETRSQRVTYQVKRGDTLHEIAKKFNTTVNSILIKNSLKTSSLSIGQILQL